MNVKKFSSGSKVLFFPPVTGQKFTPSPVRLFVVKQNGGKVDCTIIKDSAVITHPKLSHSTLSPVN